MTENRWRSPIGGRMDGYSPNSGESLGAELFALVPAAKTHPDFAARAEIWKLQREGVISIAEASRRSANIGRAVAAKAVKSGTISVLRHSRPAPNESRQYAPPMATTAARDDRLTPNAKALLQVLRARCGKGRRTDITKMTMGAVMSRSARSVARYLRDLEAFGYITTAIRATGRGLHLGLTVILTAKALPFFEEPVALAAWLAEAPDALLSPYSGRLFSTKAGVTTLSPKNQSPKISLLGTVRNRFRIATRATEAPA